MRHGTPTCHMTDYAAGDLRSHARRVPDAFAQQAGARAFGPMLGAPRPEPR
jgi:hypothetical protein